MDWTAFLGLAGTILGLAGLAGAAFAVMRSNLAKTTSELWKGEAEAAHKKAERLEEEKAEQAVQHAEALARVQADHVDCEKRLTALEAKYTVLETTIADALKAQAAFVAGQSRPAGAKTRKTDKPGKAR